MKMIKIAAAVVIGLPSATAMAAPITGVATYRGVVQAVAPGYYGAVGVELDGTTCNGYPVVLLQSSNPKYNEILSMLLTAQVTHANVALPTIANNPTSNGFCTISEGAIGYFSMWS